MWNFLLDLVSDDGRTDIDVSIFPTLDDESFMIGLLVGMAITIIMVVILYFTNKYINGDDDKDNKDK